MLSRLHLAAAGGFLALGFVVAATVWAADPAPQAAKSCCDSKMACCADGGSACCAAPDKLGCCDKGQACCQKDQACCSSPQPCCDEAQACCDEGRACCGPAGDTKLTAATSASACCAEQAKTASCCTKKIATGASQ